MHDIVYNVLKSNTSTQTNRRWKFYGGYYDRVFAGFVNLNSPGGTFDDLDVSGISGGQVSLNDSDGLPIALANVSNATIKGVRLRGTYDQNIFHFEQGDNGLIFADSTATAAVSGNYPNQYFGTAIFLTDNNVGGTSSGVNDANIHDITIRRANLFTRDGDFCQLERHADDDFDQVQPRRRPFQR